MNIKRTIRTAQSRATDARLAVQEFYVEVQQPDMELVIFFCSSHYNLDVLADEMRRLFPDVNVVGCTTAGEIGPAGYCDCSLSGASFSSVHFTAVCGLIDRLQEFNIARGQVFANTLLRRIEDRAPNSETKDCLAFLMIDGMSVREEPVVRTFQNVLGKVPLVGGSAGDDLSFADTWVFHDGAFHNDSAVLLILATTLPFRVFKTQHFVSDNERLVVTEADPALRIVKEINGLPATTEYARLVGSTVAELGSQSFANSPVVVTIDGTDFVRSIQRANADGSLTFFCAIEEGLVLRVAHGNDLMGNLTKTFETISVEIGPPLAVLACDCILRNLEITQGGMKEGVGNLFRQNNVVGFSTYGEQYGGVHINQTLTGIAFGAPRDKSNDA
ncbi:MAG TPA: nitric oxide-sensing protein NosP [Rhodoferax sp.]